MNTNRDLNKPTQNQLNQIRNEVVEQLKEKYPNSGIEFKQ